MPTYFYIFLPIYSMYEANIYSTMSSLICQGPAGENSMMHHCLPYLLRAAVDGGCISSVGGGKVRDGGNDGDFSGVNSDGSSNNGSNNNDENCQEDIKRKSFIISTISDLFLEERDGKEDSLHSAEGSKENTHVHSEHCNHDHEPTERYTSTLCMYCIHVYLYMHKGSTILGYF